MERGRSESPAEQDQNDSGNDNINNYSDGDESDGQERDDQRPPTAEVPASQWRRISGETPPTQTGSNFPRHKRSRMDVPASGPHQRVPANFTFPQAAAQIGKGWHSGRDWLVLRDGDNEPVLQTPLVVVRCKREMSGQQSGQYPGASFVIPAGTTLSQMCRLYPRHVWGEMLRIFLSEGWDARRMWELIPSDARNHSHGRHWNYFQAAMGRESDLMWFEETGERRVPQKKARGKASADSSTAPRPNIQPVGGDEMTNDAQPNNDDQNGDVEPDRDAEILQGVDLSDPGMLSLEQLEALARQNRERANQYARGIILLQNGTEDWRQAERYYLARHSAWASGVYDAYQIETGQPMGTREAVGMLQRTWVLFNPTWPGEPAVSYHIRGNWHAWWNYVGVIGTLGDELQLEYEALTAAQELEPDQGRGA